MTTFIVVYSRGGFRVTLELESLSEAFEIVGMNDILTITKRFNALSN